MKFFKLFLTVVLAAGLFVVIGCSEGDTGLMGPPGEQGERGEPGPQGDKGDSGDKGDPGLSCWDLDGDGMASADEDINGDGEYNALDCKGPKGDDGEDLTEEEPPNPEECNIMATPSSRSNPFTGSDGDDIICGTDKNDWINGGAGYDTIFGRDGNDTLMGDIADDTTTTDTDESTDSDDILHGGAGNDKLEGGDGRDILNGGAGNDILIGGEGDDTLNGGDGSDTADYSASAADEPVIVNLATGGRVEDAHEDNDTLISIENVKGGSGADTLIGDDKNNKLEGNAGDDTIAGGAGDDIIDGGTAQSTDAPSSGEPYGLDGGKGNDILIVSGTATLNDTGGINANSRGFENLTGGTTDDVLTGNKGDNVLDGGGGTNTLTGDPVAADEKRSRGKDTFVIWIRSGGEDTIKDFQFAPSGTTSVIDKIVVKRMSGTEGKSTAESTDTPGQIRIKTGSITQTILVEESPSDSSTALDAVTISAIAGTTASVTTGTGSKWLEFAD